MEVIYDSRKVSLTNPGISETFVVDIYLDPTNTLPYVDPDNDVQFLNASDEVVAARVAYSFFPLNRVFPNYGGSNRILVLNKMDLEQIGIRHWRATATYDFNVNSGTGGERVKEGENSLPYVKIDFSIGGGTRNIKKAPRNTIMDLRNEGEVVPPSALVNNWGAIGLGKDEVEGIDIPDAAMQIKVTGYYKPDFVDFDYVKTVRDVIAGTKGYGSYNDEEFMGFEPGEVQLLYASGGGTVVDIIPITFTFDIRFNVEDEEDAGFPNITMKGQDFVDYLFLEQFDDDAEGIFMTPQIRLIHEVKEPMDYTVLELPV